MKLVHLLTQYTDNKGGVYIHVKNIIQVLPKYVHIELIQLTKSTQYYATNNDNIVVHNIPDRWNLLKSNLVVRKLIKKGKFDVIHVHDYYVFFKMALLSRLNSRISTLITFHGWEGKYPPSKKSKLLKRIAELLSSRSFIVGNYLTKWYGLERSKVILGAPDKSKLENRSIISGLDYEFIYVGRLEEDNSISEYLKFIELLKINGYHHSTLIVGDGSLRKNLETHIINKKLDVKFIGYKQSPQLYLKKGKIAFAAGYLSMMEYMAGGLLIYCIYNNELKYDYYKSFQKHDQKFVLTATAENLFMMHVTMKDFEKQNFINESFEFANNLTWNEIASVYYSGLNLYD